MASISPVKWIKRSCNRRKCPADFSKPCWAHFPREYGVPGLSVHGHVLSEIGLGRAARLLIQAMDSQLVPMSITDIPLDGRQNEPVIERRVTAPGKFKGSLTVGGLASFKSMSWTPCRRQFNIAYPFWELITMPEKWKAALAHYDSFWAPSKFVKDVLQTNQDRPVWLVRQPLELPDEVPGPRHVDGMFRCLTFFDFDSMFERKNPLGALRAFRRAFPARRKDVELIVKVRGMFDRGMRTVLIEEAARDSRIRIIDRTTTREEMRQLIESADVFISLHRSEGFGFGCAEALIAGRSVVATDYSGTTDFISVETGYPVSWKYNAVPSDAYFGTQGAFWADPDIDDAAAKLQEVSSNPDEARRRVIAGFKLLKEKHSIEAVGRVAHSILKNDGIV
jgi:glycosyltransferase involved in cell wall biosynthesis